MKNAIICAVLFLMVCFAAPTRAQLPTAPPYPGPDDRYKADLLLVVAHPDDDSLISGYLARLIFDEHKRVAAIICTPGDGGGNEVAYESGAALGQVRIQEVRRALEFLGVSNIWFLGGNDTPGRECSVALERLESRPCAGRNGPPGSPYPAGSNCHPFARPGAGENHADHQAAGVIATEAFDLAGDPTAFADRSHQRATCNTTS